MAAYIAYIQCAGTVDGSEVAFCMQNSIWNLKLETREVLACFVMSLLHGTGNSLTCLC